MTKTALRPGGCFVDGGQEVCMIKNTVSSTAARLAAAALCVAAAGSLSAETINLTAAANAAGCLEYGYGPQHNTDVQNFIFAE